MNLTTGFDVQRLDVNGTDTAVLTLGDETAPPLVFFHGAGTFHGWEFARAWAPNFRVIIPHHPGFGESGDFAGLRSVDDFVLHYTALFDALNLQRDVNLVGLSLGGRIAARFAIAQQHRLRRLVLVAAAGLHVSDAPMEDIFRIPGEQIPGLLVKNIETLMPYLPTSDHDIDFIADRYRESRTTAMLAWDEPTDRTIRRWANLIHIPTLIAWGDDDALIPVGHAAAWQGLISGSTVQRFPDAGHLLLDESPAALQAVAEFCS